MENIIPTIDPYLFEKQFEAFKKFIEEQSNVRFTSFRSNPYTEKQEGYKDEIYKTAREKLAFQTWKKSDIGTGKIIDAIIDSIEFKDNNLVPWQSQYGDDNRPHHPLYEAKSDHNKVKRIEQSLFNLYHENNVIDSFNELIDIFGKKYSIIAYLYFIKDSSKYLPIATTHFDKVFTLLGVDFKTSKHCSWDNYFFYISLIRDLKQMLTVELQADITLLDAHSFAWILSSQMEKQGKLADVTEYLDLSSTEREAIVKARIGQGQFRESLINYWSTCAVTGCNEQKLLRASHIKPWAKSEANERLSLYNGLLLSPNLDVCFDLGFISFDDSGNIMISNELTEKDMNSLNINKKMKLSNIDSEHKKYLAYHRENIFTKSSTKKEKNKP
jgi:predicted restriction endonuclease